MQTFLLFCLALLIGLPFFFIFVGYIRLTFDGFVEVFGYEKKPSYLPATHKTMGILTQIIFPLSIFTIAQYFHHVDSVNINYIFVLASPIMALTLNIVIFTICLWKIRPYSSYAIERQ